MKIRYAIFVGVLCFLIGLICASCSYAITSAPDDVSITEAKCIGIKDISNYGHITKIEFEGHRYIVYSNGYGVGLTHDPDCSCKLK